MSGLRVRHAYSVTMVSQVTVNFRAYVLPIPYIPVVDEVQEAVNRVKECGRAI